jgi:hypothetical protein
VADLPFELPRKPTVLPPDVSPVLDGYEEIVSYHVGEPWAPPPEHDADALTVTAYRRLDMAEGRLVPMLYQVTYWRKAGDGR